MGKAKVRKKIKGIQKQLTKHVKNHQSETGGMLLLFTASGGF